MQILLFILKIQFLRRIPLLFFARCELSLLQNASQFVTIDVLRTIVYLHLLAIDIVSLTGNQVACRACISIEQFVYLKFFARRVGCKKLWAILKYLRSDFVVNVLRTKQYIHRIRSIDLSQLLDKSIYPNFYFIPTFHVNSTYSKIYA